MMACHHLLCFTCNRALRYSQVRMICMYRGSALGRNSSQSANRGTCFDDSDMLDRPELDAFAIVCTYKAICAKRAPLVRNHIETADRSSENAHSACPGARIRNPNRSSEKTRKMFTVGKKFKPHIALETRSANRSSEMRPKTKTVGQKKSHGINANRPNS